LSHYKCPREYHVVDDLLRSSMGKINKRKLRDAWLAGGIRELDALPEVLKGMT
jgi:acyl-CoA synthetase (AMP-forming)/AMP-acid ligase II